MPCDSRVPPSLSSSLPLLLLSPCSRSGRGPEARGQNLGTVGIKAKRPTSSGPKPKTTERPPSSPFQGPKFGDAPKSCFPPRPPQVSCQGHARNLQDPRNSGKQVRAERNPTLPWGLPWPEQALQLDC